MSPTVAVVGASLAGLSAARALRAQSFDGRIVVIGDEVHAPYDRPPLSKEFLAGTASSEDIALGAPDDEDLRLEWRLGTTAVGLDHLSRSVLLHDGSEIRADGVVLATGAREHIGEDCNGGGYTVDEVALRHGAGVEAETSDPGQAYARFPDSAPAPYRDGWLPGG